MLLYICEGQYSLGLQSVYSVSFFLSFHLIFTWRSMLGFSWTNLVRFIKLHSLSLSLSHAVGARFVNGIYHSPTKFFFL